MAQNHHTLVVSAGAAIAAATLFAGCFDLGCGFSSSNPSANVCEPSTRPPLVEPPTLRPSAHPASGVTKWFVLRHARVGLNNAAGKGDPIAWQTIGFDLDGRDTTACDSKDSKNSCHRAWGSPTAILADGPGGIDNNFGGHFMQTVKSLHSSVEDDANAVLERGADNVLLRIDGVTDGDESSAPGAFYRAIAPSGAPHFDTTDSWSVVSTSLFDGVDLARPIVTFPDGFLSKGTWVSGAASQRVELVLYAGQDAPAALPIDDALLVIPLGLGGGEGTIAGVLDRDALVAAITPTLKRFGICPGDATFDQFGTSATQCADLVLGAPQLQDTTRDCNAISLGIGLTMAPASAPTSVVPPPAPTTNDCSPRDAGGSEAATDTADAG